MFQSPSDKTNSTSPRRWWLGSYNTSTSVYSMDYYMSYKELPCLSIHNFIIFSCRLTALDIYINYIRIWIGCTFRSLGGQGEIYANYDFVSEMLFNGSSGMCFSSIWYSGIHFFCRITGHIISGYIFIFTALFHVTTVVLTYVN